MNTRHWKIRQNRAARRRNKALPPGWTVDQPALERKCQATHEAGGVVISAVLLKGPMQGGLVRAYASSQKVGDLALLLQNLDPVKANLLVHGVRCMLHRLVERMDRLTDEEDARWNAAMAGLMAAMLAWGPVGGEGIGVGALGIVISPDETKPWYRRGMLDPRVIQALGCRTIDVHP